MLRISIPAKQGIEKIILIELDPTRSWRSVINFVMPAANNMANINEYPIKWTDNDCWKTPININIEKMRGSNNLAALFELLTSK